MAILKYSPQKLPRVKRFKTCCHCGRKLSINSFPFEMHSKDGHSSICSDCQEKQRKELKEDMTKAAEKATPTTVSYPVTDNLASLKIVKTCKCCGNQLPITSFYKNSTHKDGLDSFCSSCRNRKLQEGRVLKQQREIKKQVLKLSDFTDQALFDELKRRGYGGQLLYTKKIVI